MNKWIALNWSINPQWKHRLSTTFKSQEVATAGKSKLDVLPQQCHQINAPQTMCKPARSLCIAVCHGPQNYTIIILFIYYLLKVYSPVNHTGSPQSFSLLQILVHNSHIKTTMHKGDLLFSATFTLGCFWRSHVLSLPQSPANGQLLTGLSCLAGRPSMWSWSDDDCTHQFCSTRQFWTFFPLFSTILRLIFGWSHPSHFLEPYTRTWGFDWTS